MKKIGALSWFMGPKMIAWRLPRAWVSQPVSPALEYEQIFHNSIASFSTNRLKLPYSSSLCDKRGGSKIVPHSFQPALAPSSAPSNQDENRPYRSLEKMRLHPLVKLKDDMFSTSIGS
jgi:hypothetical protein